MILFKLGETSLFCVTISKDLFSVSYCSAPYRLLLPHPPLPSCSQWSQSSWAVSHWGSTSHLLQVNLSEHHSVTHSCQSLSHWVSHCIFDRETCIGITQININIAGFAWKDLSRCLANIYLLEISYFNPICLFQT